MTTLHGVRLAALLAHADAHLNSFWWRGVASSFRHIGSHVAEQVHERMVRGSHLFGDVFVHHPCSAVDADRIAGGAGPKVAVLPDFCFSHAGSATVFQCPHPLGAAEALVALAPVDVARSTSVAPVVAFTVCAEGYGWCHGVCMRMISGTG